MGLRWSLDSRIVTNRITRTDVEHVAQLARLQLKHDEVDRYAEQLNAILDHAAQVSALDTSGVAPTAHPLALVNVLRSDTVAPTVNRAEVLAAAPSAQDDRFRVPRILGEAP